mgnify:CR=1 FL=1|nr:efflux RND transporter periplasmic adaptor subunit [uncultured Dongia sp.]
MYPVGPSRTVGKIFAWIVPTLALALAVGTIAVVVADQSQSAARPTQTVPALAVTSATVQRQTWPVTITAPGPVAAWQEAILGSQLGGYRLTEVSVEIGDRVKKGQVLARLDTAMLRAEELQLKAGRDEAEANNKRATALKQTKTMSERDYLQYSTQAKKTSAALAAVQLQLSYANIVAPDDGTISAKTATLGEVLSVGQELFRLIRQDRLEWRGELTAMQLSQAAVGQTLVLALPNGDTANATIRQLAPSLDPSSRLGMVYADLAPGTSARAGMYAEGTIDLGRRAAFVVPAESVVIRDGRNYVLKLKPDRNTADALATVTLQAVEVGRRRGRDVEILDGVADGDEVVVSGAGFLKDGDTVHLESRPAAGKSAPAVAGREPRQ